MIFSRMYRVRYGVIPLLALAHFAVGSDEAMANDTQQDLFDALYTAPDDRDLMLQYARASDEAGDYEAAVATLERLHDQEPDNQEARLELAKGYFALGQNDLAAYHLDIYLSRGDLTAEQTAAASALADEAAQRSSGIRYAGSVEAGLVHSSEVGETGLSYRGVFGLSFDLGGATPHSWDTILRLDGRSYNDDNASDSYRFFLRTGPTFLLNGQAFGPRIQPYVELGSVDDEDVVEDGERALIGANLTVPIDATWSVFADVAYGIVDRDDTAGDADMLRASVGADFWPTEQLRLRVLVLHQDEDADDGGIDRDRNTARLDTTYFFSPSFNPSGRDWELNAFIQGDNETSTGSVEDDYLSYGASVKSYVRNDIFLRLSARQIDRDSSIANQSRDDTVVSLTAGWEF